MRSLRLVFNVLGALSVVSLGLWRAGMPVSATEMEFEPVDQGLLRPHRFGEAHNPEPDVRQPMPPVQQFNQDPGMPRPGQSEEQFIPEQEMRRPRRSGDLLNLEQARQYMLKLINRDRASQGAPPVVLDDVATAAGQLHSDEMAEYGYLSHWTMDGRKPDQRYTECGGNDVVMENVDSYNDPNPPKLPLCREQLFSRKDLEDVEGQYFNEKPPNDGHRVNILDPNHTAVGIGLSVAGAQPGSDDGFPRTACTQEFINHYGTYTPLPRSVAPGQSFLVEGTLVPGLQFDCIDLRWEQLPQPMSVAELDKTSSYSIPEQITQSYFSPPYESPAPVNLSQQDGGQHFSLNLPTGAEWRPGIYYVTVWAKKGGGNAFSVSTRTVRIGPPGKKSGRLGRPS